MLRPFNFAAFATVAALGLAGCDRAPIPQAEAAPRQERQQQASPERRSQEGEASYYGAQFNGRKMANGERFDPRSDSAAHRSLPLGTTARVENLQNGRSTTVRVEDRGPYAKGRIIDLSPGTAEQLGMKHQGHAPVRVTPLEVPERDVRPGQRQAQR